MDNFKVAGGNHILDQFLDVMNETDNSMDWEMAENDDTQPML